MSTIRTGPPVNGSDAVFAAVAAARWLADGLPARWPTDRRLGPLSLGRRGRPGRRRRMPLTRAVRPEPSRGAPDEYARSVPTPRSYGPDPG